MSFRYVFHSFLILDLFFFFLRAPSERNFRPTMTNLFFTLVQRSAVCFNMSKQLDFDSAIYRPIRPFWTYLQDPHVYDETQSFLSNVGVLL